MAYNQLQKLNDNIEALRIALAWDKAKALDANKAEALKKYSGFGGIKAILYPNAAKEEWVKLNATNEDLRLYSKIIELHKLLKDNLQEQEYKAVIGSIKNSVLTAFYTPQVVPQTFYAALKDNGIDPKRIYEPSSGAGIFITEAVKAFPNLEHITVVEKDILTGRVLDALSSSLPVPSTVHITGFENTPISDNYKYDLIVSNIPFGNFSVYDDAFLDKDLTGKIHNYFFAKGLDKIADGGLLAYITTDAFLNSPSNKLAREYLFNRSDFISLSVMPDNLMKDTGNTEAPSHLLIVQKNECKKSLSVDEQQLIGTIAKENKFGSFHLNSYINLHPEVIAADEIKAGKNQYGNANQSLWQYGDINAIAVRLSENINEGIEARFSKNSFRQAQSLTSPVHRPALKQLTFLPVPESKTSNVSVQLGLFDTAPAENINRAIAYLSQIDATVVEKVTARIVSTVKTTTKPEHESVVLLTAKALSSKQYVYKLYSNVEEVNFSANWKNAGGIENVLKELSGQLKQFGHNYTYEGDKLLENSFGLKHYADNLFTNLKPFYKEGTLVIHKGEAGTISKLDSEFKQATFHPFLSGKREKGFYEQYITIRDSYIELAEREFAGNVEYAGLRETLKDGYEKFINQYGSLNYPNNRKLITNDSAFGFTILSSLERKEGELYVQADILTLSLHHKQEQFRTDDPIEALAQSLNENGKVDIGFIGASTGLTKAEIINQLEGHIYLNPKHNEWETVDQYLSGNVVDKLHVAQQKAALQPDNVQIQKSLEAITKVQPEKIPFELLDFNLGERWIPNDYYNRFACDLFKLKTSVNYFQSLDTFKVSTSGNNAKISQEYAVTPKSGRTTYGYTMVEHALENTTPFFTYEVKLPGDKTIRLPDNEAIQLAHEKIEKIRNGFISWLQDLPQADKKHLETLYNNTFNCYVLRQYNGEHLTFPGLERKNLGIEDLYSSQKNAAWRIIQNRGALVDHEVGLGKTLTIIVSAQEMKRLGIVHKPMILALKANINQITETYRKAYPDARILAPGENDFTPAKRMRLFHEIKNNNWDCIILTHDQFGKIPQSPEIQREIFQN
jgi:hypothetical protein